MGSARFCLISGGNYQQAAADPRIRDDVVFINSFGAYSNARDLFLQIASRTRFYQGLQEPWEVDRLTWLIIANELIETVDDRSDQEILKRSFLQTEGASSRCHCLGGGRQTSGSDGSGHSRNQFSRGESSINQEFAEF
jgi:hypothetical protein